MANPQTDNGFTRIANEILESVYSRKFAANQLSILMVIWRYTYGFQRKSHEFSLMFLSDATGIERKSIKRSLDSLINSKVLIVVKEAGFTSARVLEFNKNYTQWAIDSRGGQSDPTTGGKVDPSPVGESDPTTGGCSDPQERKVKDNYKESIKDNNKGLPMVDEYFGEVIKFYEQNIGLISPYVSQQIGYLVDESNSELVLLALKKSVEANANNKFKYARAIVDSWKSQNFKTIEDVENDEKRKSNINPSRGNVHSLFEASPETLERQRRMVEEHQKNKKEIDYTDLPY